MSFAPRDYQSIAIAKCIDGFNAAARVMIVMATGTGKTVVAAHIGNHFITGEHGRVLILAHRDELIRQAAAKFQHVTGEVPSIEKGDEFSDETGFTKPKIVVSSFQTQYSGKGERKRMHRFDPKEFALLWIDECHHALAESYRKVIEYYAQGNPDLKVLGVTATADRGDGQALGEVFEECVYRYELPDAIKDGYLVRVHPRIVAIEGLDLSKVSTTAGDLNQKELNDVVLFEEPLHGVVQATIERACGLDQGYLATIKDEPDRVATLARMIDGKRIRPTLIFAVSVLHAQRMAEIINRWITGSANHVAGDGDPDKGFMPMEQRRAVMRDFREGRLKFLVSVMVCTEGYDEPSVEVVSMARPTKSRALFAQMIGRGTRPLESIADTLGTLPSSAERCAVIAESIKPAVEVLDFVGNAGKHRLVTTADALGGERFSPAIIDRANELIEDGQVAEVEDALAMAQEESEMSQAATRELYAECAEDMDAADEQRRLDEDKRRREGADRRANVVAATENYHVQEIDPFGNYHGPKVAAQQSQGGATEKQVKALVGMGVKHDTATGYSVKQAGAVLTSLRASRCSEGQAKFMRSLGFNENEIRECNFEQASKKIDEAKNGVRA